MVRSEFLLSPRDRGFWTGLTESMIQMTVSALIGQSLRQTCAW